MGSINDLPGVRKMPGRQTLIKIAMLGSAALLLGALAFQFIGGLAPCMLCIWQRWPHVAALMLGALGLCRESRIIPAAGALASLATAGIGIFHTGVERAWWNGLQSCTGGADISRLSAEDALELIMAAKVVACDEVAWQMLGLSMASWNAIASLVLAGIWVAAARQSRH